MLNKVPVPSWKSKVVIEDIYSSQEFDVWDWGIEIVHNPVVAHSAKRSKTSHSKKKRLMDITGRITIYNQDGLPEPDSTFGRITIYIGGKGSGYYTVLELPNVVIETYSYPMEAQKTITTRVLNFQAYAGYGYHTKSYGALIIS